MTLPDHHPGPLWPPTPGSISRPKLEKDLPVDVAVVGAGITGLTAALLLSRAGKRVAVFERSRVAGAESGLSTAHLTEVTDLRFASKLKSLGSAGTRLLAEATRASLERIATLIIQHGIACRFQRVPGYLYSEHREEAAMLHAEADAARRSGVRAAIADQAPLAFAHTAIRFEDQAQLNPREYLLGLARALPCPIFEHTPVSSVRDGEPCRVETEYATLSARDVLIATHAPINNRLLLHTKLAAYRTYAIAAPLGEVRVPPGLFWDTGQPSHYARRQTTPEGEFLIVGGEDHRTGEEGDTEERLRRREEYLASRFQLRTTTHRWSGQILEPVDGLPYIGRNPFDGHVYVATGYSGTGMTFGTLAAMVVTDLVLGRQSRYAELLTAGRLRPVASSRRFAAENFSFPRHLWSDKLAGADVQARSVEEVGREEGKIVRAGGVTLAVSREPDGRLHLLSPTCPHLGCHVRWNNSESSWDCPCHGSRFSAAGEVLNGPANSGLEPSP